STAPSATKKEKEEWIDDYLEDQLELTDEVKARLEQSRREIAAGQIHDEAAKINRGRRATDQLSTSELASHWKNPEQVSADMLTNARYYFRMSTATAKLLS